MFGYQMSEYDKRVYEEELREFLPSRLTDCHTHIWKREFGGETPGKGCVSWTRMVAKDCTAEDLLQTYRDMLPGKTVTPVLMGQPEADLSKTNCYTREAARKYRLPALYCTDYAMPAEFLEKEVTEGGFAGLKPYLNRSPSSIPGNEVRIFDFLTPEHLRLADRRGWIVMLHIPRPMRLRDPLNLAQMMEIEENYPNVKLIIAHIGRAYAEEDLGTAFELLRKTKNMLFDFTANTLDRAMIACLEAVGPKRFLFGSDLPIVKMRMYRTTENGFYYNHVPRGLYGDVSGDPHMVETDEKNITNFLYEELLAFKRAAKALRLTASEVEDILCRNAEALFGIS